MELWQVPNLGKVQFSHLLNEGHKTSVADLLGGRSREEHKDKAPRGPTGRGRHSAVVTPCYDHAEEAPAGVRLLSRLEGDSVGAQTPVQMELQAVQSLTAYSTVTPSH